MSVAHKNYRDHSADPGPRPASQPGGRAAAAQRAQAHRSRAWRRRRSRKPTQKTTSIMPDQTRIVLKKRRRDHAPGRRRCSRRPPARRRQAPRRRRRRRLAAARAEGEAASGRAGPARRSAGRRRAASGPDRRHRRGSGSLSLIANILINLALFAVLAVGGGLGTAWYMIEAGSRLSTRTLRAVDHVDRGRAAGRRPLHARAHDPQRAAAARLDAGAHLPGQGRQPRRAPARRPASTPSSWTASTAPGGAWPPSTARAA